MLPDVCESGSVLVSTGAANREREGGGWSGSARAGPIWVLMGNVNSLGCVCRVFGILSEGLVTP